MPMSIFLTSLVSATLISAGPRVLEHAAVADVRSALTEATAEERGIRFTLEGRVDADAVADPFAELDRRNAELLQRHMPASVAAFVSDRQWLYDSPLFRVRSFPEQAEGPDPTTFHFRYQQGIEEQIAVVRGRLPASAAGVVSLLGADCPPEGSAPDDFEPEAGMDCQLVDLPVLETAITQQTASELGVDVGARLTLTPATQELAWRRVTTEALGTVVIVEIAGIIELTDPSDEYWFDDNSLHRPSITEATFRVNPRMIYAAGLLMPEQYHEFMQQSPAVDNRYTWRYVVDPGAEASANAERFAADVGRISPAGYETSSLLPDLLGEHIAQRRLAEQLIATSLSGMYWVAVAAIVALALLVTVRQRSTTGLVIDRGASPRQVRVNATRTALLIIGLPAAIGWTMAWRAFPSTSSGLSTRSAIAFVIGGFVAIVATSVPIASNRRTSTSDWRRAVVEIAVVVGAVGSVVLLRRRSPVSERVDDGLDVLLISTPALIAVAAGVLAARCVGPVARAGATVGSRRRTLGPFVGFRRLAVQPAVLRAPAIVMTIAFATAVLSFVLVSSVASAQRTAVWYLVGGDYRVQAFVDGVPLPPGFDVGTTDGRSSVSGVEVVNQRIADGSRAATVTVAAIDAGPYRAMLEESGVTGADLDDLADAAVPAAAVPVVAVGEWPNRGAPKVGDVSTLTVEQFLFDVEVVAVAERFPALAPGSATVVMDLEALRLATNDRVAQPTFALVSGADGELSELAELAADQGALAIVTSRFDRLDSIAGDPLSTWTNRSLRAVTVVSLLFVGLTAGSAAAIASGNRRRDLALLGVLGLRPRRFQLIAAIEHVPTVVSALAFGGAAGIGTSLILEPALGLSAFGDGGSAIDVDIGGIAIVGLVLVAGVVAAVGVALAHRTTEDRDIASLMRVGVSVD